MNKRLSLGTSKRRGFLISVVLGDGEQRANQTGTLLSRIAL